MSHKEDKEKGVSQHGVVSDSKKKEIRQLGEEFSGHFVHTYSVHVLACTVFYSAYKNSTDKTAFYNLYVQRPNVFMTEIPYMAHSVQKRFCGE